MRYVQTGKAGGQGGRRVESAVGRLVVGGCRRGELREGKREGTGRLSEGKEDGFGRRREGEGLVVWV